jgi:glycyl-tRNA synthetase beta chain
MADLLLELFSEEIPARMQADAISHLQKSLSEKLGQPAKGFVTPRRLAVIISNLPAVQPDVNTELKGPKVGAPQAAIDGFLKKSGMKLEDLQQQDGVYVAKIFQKGKPTAEILKPIIEEILKNFPWPKSMRWGANETSWVRPLHSILCIFDGKVVPVEFAGVKAGDTTRGHRFLAPGAITIDTPEGYEAALKKAFVMADRDTRKAEILKQATALASANDLRLKTDDSLLEEVTGLVEWPNVLMGTIDKNYMDLPPEVLVSEMRAHQKYFACETKDGTFSDKFLITSNMVARDEGKAIIAGNERVLRARLADGCFFWDQDRKKKLEDWAKGLETVTYHAKLGTVADKVARIEKLALLILSSLRAQRSNPDWIAASPAAPRDDDVKRAAALCKADLTTGMVGEFPELQGVMGRYYALHQGESPDVADAIRDHYLPLGPSSPVPTKPVSVCIALADKLDTLISMFAIGEKPTGSKDPFALRRSALGVIRIVLENNIRLPLSRILSSSAAHRAVGDLHPFGTRSPTAQSAAEDDGLMTFFHDRLIVQLKDSGIRHDVIKAVIANGDDDLVRIVNRAKAVQAFLDTDDGKNLLAGYKRAANILAIEEKKDKKVYPGGVNLPMLQETAEKSLFEKMCDLDAPLAEALNEERYDQAGATLAVLRPFVDQFFDSIMVNVENTELRENRLNLLAQIKRRLEYIADFSLIEGDSKDQKKAA